MNREQRRRQARQKGAGQSYADVIARRKIGQQTLRMAMEDQAVLLAADIICQRQLWGAVVALNEQFGFGEKRTRDFLEAMERLTDEFDRLKEEHGDAYAEEKLRQRAEKVSGIRIMYQHEAEREYYERMKAGGGEIAASASPPRNDNERECAAGPAAPRNDTKEEQNDR